MNRKKNKTSTSAHLEGAAKNTFREKLLLWFEANKRDMPWRKTQDPYKIWISEILLQQTRVEAGTPYYLRFIKRFPTVQSLARGKMDEVLKLWEGLGYYARARNLHKAAKTIVADYDGKLPTSAKGWEQIPGVGPYTAGAIASMAFGERAAILDGNVTRVLARIFLIEDFIDEGKTRRELWRLSANLLPVKKPGDFNQAMMELGATLCLPKNPLCLICPLQKFCLASKAGKAQQLPRKKPKRKIPHYQIVAGALKAKGKYLIGKRPEGGMLGGLWEFPGGKVQSGEALEEALKREFFEETGAKVRVGKKITSIDHAYSHFSITLNLYACALESGRPTSKYHESLKWVMPGQFKEYAFPSANLKFLHLLK